ncbi:MAG: hypothetical protein JXA90_00155, partial [Planctomycetes bacterium]|nr:hypothetical protein [Planctomycetota bacterium]
VQLFRDEAPVGGAVDLYAREKEASTPISMGTLELTEGINNLLFKLVGKNEKSAGLGFDLIHIICERVN